MASAVRKEYGHQMLAYLQEKMRSAGEPIVYRHEVDELARSVGMDEDEAWQMFKSVKGVAWQGRYLEESRSEERGYTAARLTRV